FSISWEGGPNQFWYSTLYQNKFWTCSPRGRQCRQKHSSIRWIKSKNTTRKDKFKRQDLSFFSVKKETKKPALCHLSKKGFCSRPRLKSSKGQVVFFQKSTEKISTFKPLLLFILSVVVSLPKAVLSKNQILSSF